MFDLFKKKKTEAFFAPVDGQFVPLAEVWRRLWYSANSIRDLRTD